VNVLAPLAIAPTPADDCRLDALKSGRRRAGWHADMLAHTEALCRSGSFEIFLPTGELVLSPGLRALLGEASSQGELDHLDRLAWIPEEERPLIAGFWRQAVPGEAFDFQHRILTASGRRLVVLHRGMLDAPVGGVQRGVALLQDITERHEAERRVHELASQDKATGLPNRVTLLDQLDAALHAARWVEHGVWLLTIEVPRLAEVRAKMGFSAGDTLVRVLGARLRQACEPGETLARLGGTVFALFMEAPCSADPLPPQQRATALLRCLQAPVRLGTTDIYSHGLVGIAGFPADGQSAEELLERAQSARLGLAAGSDIAFFRPEANAQALREMEIESLLGTALERGELTLAYQPKVDLANGRICGAETLLCWHSPALGEVSPQEFLPIAERSGLIGSLSEWVLAQTCHQAAAFMRAGLAPLRLAIKLPAAQLHRPDLARHVADVLQAAGVPPQWLGIDITETALTGDLKHAGATLREIRALGVEISLDGFGIGYSSLSHLHNLPIDVLKIDRSFVHDITRVVEDVSVTRAILSMAHGLHMQVLAEGVETEGQLRLLAANRCDAFQGPWFSAPVPPAELEALVREARCLPDRFLTRVRRRRTLLLVDDEDNILSALRRLLRRDGYDIITAGNAAEALQRLAEQEVDVILSDQRMPGMTGVEFLRCAKDIHPDAVRMVLSGYTELQSIIDAVNEGAIYRFLTKPWDDAMLRAHVAEAFRHKEMADENRRLADQVASANSDLAQLNTRLELLLQQQRDRAELMAANAGTLRELIDALPAAVLGVDAEGSVAFANRQAEALLPPATLLGQPLEQVLGVPLRAAGPAATAVRLDGRPYRLLCGAAPAPCSAQGRLLMLLPQATEVR
jgi:diguanylate cyclase (GGDEF)-like protein